MVTALQGLVSNANESGVESEMRAVLAEMSSLFSGAGTAISGVKDADNANNIKTLAESLAKMENFSGAAKTMQDAITSLNDNLTKVMKKQGGQ